MELQELVLKDAQFKRQQVYALSFLSIYNPSASFNTWN